MLLEGEALAVWLELSDEDRKDYKKAKEHLLKSMMLMEFISINEYFNNGNFVNVRFFTQS